MKIHSGSVLRQRRSTFSKSLLGISTTISGMDSVEVLDRNPEIPHPFKLLFDEPLKAPPTSDAHSKAAVMNFSSTVKLAAS